MSVNFSYFEVVRRRLGSRSFSRLAALIWLLAFFFLPSVSAYAGGYTVAYAIDVGDKDVSDKNDPGKTIECSYKQECEIESGRLQLSIFLSFWEPDRSKVHIHVFGKNIGCCYFVDGADSVSRDPTERLIRLYIYEGQRRKRNEYILNTPIAALYLSFSELK